MDTWLRTKRKATGLSQAEVAEVLSISRPTYIRLEQGLAKATVEQEALLSSVFGMSRASLNKQGHIPAKVQSAGPIVKSVPRENVEKFKQVLLYIVSKVGSRPNIGQTAIYKLLYFIDFDFYEKHQKYLIGARYIKNTYGPTPVSFAKIVKDLEAQGELVSVQSKHFNYDQRKYLVTAEPSVSALSAEELKHIDDELLRLGARTARELSDLSHIDTPWRVAEDKKELNYRHVFYRPDETSVSEN